MFVAGFAVGGCGGAMALRDKHINTTIVIALAILITDLVITVIVFKDWSVIYLFIFFFIGNSKPNRAFTTSASPFARRYGGQYYLPCVLTVCFFLGISTPNLALTTSASAFARQSSRIAIGISGRLPRTPLPASRLNTLFFYRYF